MDPIRFDPQTGMFAMPHVFSLFADLFGPVLWLLVVCAATMVIAHVAALTFRLLELIAKQRASLRGVRK